MQLALKHATVYVGGKLVVRDVAYEDGRFLDSPSLPQGFVFPDSAWEDKLLIPGLVDVHVHLREPGFFYKESIASGTRAAARGGYTAVCAMPNLNPPPDGPENLRAEREIIAQTAAVRVYPYACITKGQKGETLCDYRAMKGEAVAFSDDGHGVQSESVMRSAMEAVARMGGLLAAHCEDNALLHGGCIHDGAYAKAHGHKGISSESEWGQVKRDLRLAKETGCRYHVCHVSTKESVALIRQAQKEGVDVSCETAPHYLLLCDDDLQEDGRFKMNPPLRGKDDRDALVEGLLDGTIDMIATDHAPHSAEEKGRGLENSLMGVVGLECAFPALYTGLVRTGIVPLERLLAAMTDAPRKRFGLPPVSLAADDAGCAFVEDFSVFDLNEEYRLNPAEFVSKGRATPFEGWLVRGRCLYTAVGGKEVWRM